DGGAVTALILLVILSGANALPDAEANRLEAIERLKKDIKNTNAAIAETEKLIARSADATYLPDLNFRLAELYAEKSRYVYQLQGESRPKGQRGPIVSIERK